MRVPAALPFQSEARTFQPAEIISSYRGWCASAIWTVTLVLRLAARDSQLAANCATKDPGNAIRSHAAVGAVGLTVCFLLQV